MLRNYFLKFVIILNVTKYCESIFTNTKQNIIESLNEELNIKHFCIIKDDNFPIDQEIIRFAKNVFEGKIFMSFVSVSRMNLSMITNYKTPLQFYYFPKFQEKRIELEKYRNAWVFPPKTIVVPYSEKVKHSIGKLFTEENRLGVSKYTWLIFDENNSFKLLKNSKDNYIPFNCQFLIVKNPIKETGDYAIEEMYNPSIETSEFFVRHFGTWTEANGLTIWTPDFYQRRLDMNGTVLVAIYDEEYILSLGFNIEIANIISQIMNIRLKFKTNKLTQAENYDNWALHLNSKLLSALFFQPYFIGPFWKQTLHFYLAYNKKYEQHEVSPLLKPFSFNLWLAVLGWLIISAITITIILKQVNKRRESKLNSQIPASDCLYEPFDSILNQDGGVIPAEPSVQIVSIASRIVALVLAPLYTGAIASFILIPIIKLPFTTPKEFVQDGSYKLEFTSFAKLDNYLSLSNDQWIQEISRNFMVPISGRLENSLNEEIKTMCDDYKIALLETYYAMEVADNIDCKIIKIRSPVVFSWSAMNLNFESPYRTIFNRIFTSIRSTGNFRNHLGKFSKEGAGSFNMFEPISNNDTKEVELSDLAPIFTLIGVLYIFSAIILLGEISHFKKPKQNQI